MSHAAASSKPALGFLGALVLATAFGVWATFFTGPQTHAEQVIAKGQDTIMLHYINNANWGTIRCKDTRYRTYEVYYCHPSLSPDIGGLHIIREEGGEPVVFPINGTAMGKMRQTRIRAVEGGEVAVQPWDGALIDIPEAIEAARKG